MEGTIYGAFYGFIVRVFFKPWIAHDSSKIVDDICSVINNFRDSLEFFLGA